LEGASDHSLITVGAQPVWNPAEWPEVMRRNRSLRAQLNRARNKAISVEEWERSRAAGDADLRRILDEWMDSRAMPRLQFLTESVPPHALGDRRIFVAIRNGLPIGFLVCTPIPSRSGWMIEQIVRGKTAPNGMSELLVDCAMERFREEGAEIVTLGLAPLSRRAHSDRIDSGPLVKLLLAWTRAHGRRFYNFEGLDAFKAKFRPDRWEPVYAIAKEPRLSLKTLYAIAAAFTEGPPLRFFWRAIAAAALQEAVWFKSRAGKLLPVRKE
jgi:phosphatidylglycerol lysyltransferase